MEYFKIEYNTKNGNLNFDSDMNPQILVTILASKYAVHENFRKILNASVTIGEEMIKDKGKYPNIFNANESN